MRVVYLVLRILFGLLFIGSAVLKLFPIDAFELVLIKQVGFSWDLAPLFARLIIISEFAIGVSIAFGYRHKASLIGALGMLVFFSAFLVYQIAIGQGDENCGCFGELIPMDAPTSIAKNLVFIAWVLVLLWQIDKDYRWRFSWISLILWSLAAPALFIALPLPSVDMNQEPTIETELIHSLNSTYDWDLESNKKLIVVMMAKCVHCKQLASLLSSIDTELADKHMRIFIYGKEEDIETFKNETGITEFQVKKSGSRSLLQAINGTFPSAILVEDGSVISNWTGKDLNIDLLAQVLNNKE